MVLCFKSLRLEHDGARSDGGPAGSVLPPGPAPPTPSKLKGANQARASELKKLFLSVTQPTMQRRDQLVINLECIDNGGQGWMGGAVGDTTAGLTASTAAWAPGPASQGGLLLDGQANGDAASGMEPAGSVHGGTQGPPTSPMARTSTYRGFVRVQSISLRPGLSGQTSSIPVQAYGMSGQISSVLGSTAQEAEPGPHPQSPSQQPIVLPPGLVEEAVANNAPEPEQQQQQPVGEEQAAAGGNRSLNWTASRRALAVLVVREEHLSRTDKAMHLLSHNQRLAERLERLNLEMVIMAGDGNCQFRTLANELFGSQEYHRHVRAKVIEHIRANRDMYECFLGEDFEAYVSSMARDRTWGDELTLRAACEAYGVTLYVVTSDAVNWFLTYEPEQPLADGVELFLTYIAPIHYNAIRRKPTLRQLSKQLGSSFKRLGLSRSGRMQDPGIATQQEQPLDAAAPASSL